MPDMNAPLKLGINNWNQYSDWEAFLAAQQRADGLGFDSIWTWDHLYPIVGSHEGPIFECLHGHGRGGHHHRAGQRSA